jgi:hypothetical protein
MEKNSPTDIRVAVFSDTHGIKEVMRDTLSDFGPFDMMLHLGDGARDGIAVSKEFGIQLHGVCGNEDYGVNLKEQLLLEVNKWSCLLFHGYHMELNPFQSQEIWKNHFRNMHRAAVNSNASVLLFGHTHKPLLKRIDNVLLCNPGSPSLQYVRSTAPSFAILEASQKKLEISLLNQDPNGKWSISMSDRICCK